MEWPSVEQELAAARHEIEELRDQVHDKELAVRGLEVAILHHVQKAEELEGILEARGSEDELSSELHVKAVQNASLVVEVDDMRDQLKKSLEERKILEAELSKASDRIKRLEGERRSNQRLLVEISDVVRMLGRIDVDFINCSDIASDWNDAEHSLDSIKLKVRAIEEDRQKLLQSNRDLQTELFEKSIEIDSCRNQSDQLEAANLDIDRLELQNKKLQEHCTEKDALIKSLEQSLVDSKRAFGAAIPQDIEYEQNSESTNDECEDSSQYTSMEAQLQENGSVMVVPSVANVSRLTADHARYALETGSDDDDADFDAVSFSSLESPHDALDTSSPEPPKALNFYEEILEEEVTKLKIQLEKSHLEVKMAKKKQDLREKMLRDVIFQYKELQKEHDATEARLSEIRIHCHDDIDPAIDYAGEQSYRVVPKKSAQKASSAALLEESSTFDTAETSADASSRAQSLSASSSQAQSLSALATTSIHTKMTGLPFEVPSHSNEGCRQREKEATLLEHEYDDAVARIANIEEDLNATKRELESVQAHNIVKQSDLVELQHKYDHLQVDHQALMEKMGRLQDDLKFAQEQTREAREKRDERENDLWDVIDQYKKLSIENEEKLSKMQGVENQLNQTQALMESLKQELALTKRQIKRNDLVYDHMRMKQQLADFKTRVETLERNLSLAKTEAAINKEEGKGTRSRLVGCHFHHRKLQMQYDELLVQKSNLERDLTRAERKLETQKAQHGSWTEKLTRLREKREETAVKNKKLLVENTELKAYCNKLLTLASKSIEAL